MSVNASQLRAGMALVFNRLMVTVERVAPDRDGMVTAWVRDTLGALVAVRFHSSEHLTVRA